MDFIRSIITHIYKGLQLSFHQRTEVTDILLLKFVDTNVLIATFKFYETWLQWMLKIQMESMSTLLVLLFPACRFLKLEFTLFLTDEKWQIIVISYHVLYNIYHMILLKNIREHYSNLNLGWSIINVNKYHLASQTNRKSLQIVYFDITALTTLSLF